MSLTVKHLNADSTFLLTFSPDRSPPRSSNLKKPPGTFTVLIDPWLTGDSIVGKPWFAITKHTVPSCIQHLSEIAEPDIVLVSQNKPDHCHGATLRQLSPDSKSYIVAEPGAAKAIRGYKHFKPSRIVALPRYSPYRPFSVCRVPIPALSPAGLPGEVTIAFIPAKNYTTGLHNAIGVTYLAPTAVRSLTTVSTIDLPIKKQSYPTSPPATVSSDLSSSLSSTSSDYLPIQHPSPNERPFSPLSPTTLTSKSITDVSLPVHPNAVHFAFPPTPPESPMSTTTFTSSTPTLINAQTSTPGRVRPLSVLYSPHGIPFSPDLLPYATYHLVPSAALPLTLLLHSFDRVQNPWYFGGNISAGTRGGVNIAWGLMARCWMSAHDEAKDDQGLSVSRVRVARAGPVEVKRALCSGEEGEWLRQRGWNCDVQSLEVGAEKVLRAC